MTRTLSLLIVVIAVAVGAGASMPSQVSGDSHQPTPKELSSLAKAAHTPEQFRALAGYYGQMEAKYLERAADEKKEWERRRQITAALAQKYPRPADAARNLYEYFSSKAAEMGDLKTKYEGRAEAGDSGKIQ